MTYNNYACLYRKTKELKKALSYLEKALDLEYFCLNYYPGASTSDELNVDITVGQSLIISNPAEIHLNVCAVLSQMGEHENAIHHAKKALILI